MLHTHLAALALAAGAVAASGCGSSAKSESTSAGKSASATIAQSSTTAATTPTVTVASGKPLSHAQWTAQGDSVCTRLLAQLAGTTAKTNPEFARALSQSAVYVRASVTQLAKLVPPAAKETDWQEYLTGLQEMAANSVTLAQTVQAGSFNNKLPILTVTQTIHKRIRALARHDGFKSCSRV